MRRGCLRPTLGMPLRPTTVPSGGDLNTGHSYISMLDGHVQKVTVSDQLRKSRRVKDLPDSRLGPGGNLALAWPLDIPPLGGWDNQ